MPYLYLPGQPVRFDDNSEIVANLERKGWAIVSDPPGADSVWDGNEWQSAPPPPPEPQWLQFGAALALTPVAEKWFAELPKINSILGQMIGGGLLQAADGNTRTFVAGWEQCRAIGIITPELTAAVVGLATQHHLPEDFVRALDGNS
jgi:hypothetical protein